MKLIKFRSSHYKNITNVFYKFTYWGKIDNKGNDSTECFCSPASVSGCYRKVEEQFTGLKDKNEVAIYEGDKVEYTIFDHNGNDSQFKGVVEWFGSGFIITQIPDTFNNGEFGLELYWVVSQDEELEVIGNIHQS